MFYGRETAWRRRLWFMLGKWYGRAKLTHLLRICSAYFALVYVDVPLMFTSPYASFPDGIKVGCSGKTGSLEN